MKWIGLPENFNYEEYAGFVYLITNLITSRKYIGRKYFSSTTRKKVEGRKNRKITIKESDWKDYNSSCKELKDDIKKLGVENFSFEILSIHKTKGETNYEEIAEQFKRDVLKTTMSCGIREYYNSNIMSRYFIPKDFGSPEYIEKCNNISKAIKRGYENGTIVHPLKGKVHPNKGKKLPQTGHKLNIGLVCWNDGIVSIRIPKGQDPPQGYKKGLIKKPSSYPDKIRASYENNPKLCQICKFPISYGKHRSNKTCSKICANKIRSVKSPKKAGLNNHLWKYYYVTPKGIFTTAKEAAIPNNCSDVTVRNRCKANKEGWTTSLTKE